MKKLAKDLCPPVLWRGMRALRPSQVPDESSREVAEIDRLYRLGKQHPTSTWLIKPGFLLPDPWSFISMYGSYFRKEAYKFVSPRPDPLILDGGSNIGVGIHYWKKLYPSSRIVAFEADPDIYQTLSRNCSDLKGVELRQQALWVDTGPLTFSAVGADGGHISDLGEGGGTIPTVTVPAIRLRDLLVEQVDLLKLDIEGAEIAVIQDCADRLEMVSHIFVEHHSFASKPQELGSFFSVLERAGFRLHIEVSKPAKQPFMERPVSNQKDLRLNVFGVKSHNR